jgi:DNA repair protein RecN (Recombination protein N)
MNVLTGETGAGKSLIVEAVNLLRGGRASADIPRTGTDQAVVEAVFEDPSPQVGAILSEAGLPDMGTEVLVRRVIQRGGRSRTYVNGALTTATRLSEIGQYLVDLSGQHQHQGLVDPKRHRQILDAFADAPDLLIAMDECWKGLAELRKQLEQLSGDERARHDRIDYLKFQLDELDEAQLAAGEDDELRSEREKLAGADKLEAGARNAEQLLYGGEVAAADLVSSAMSEIEPLVAVDRSLSELLDQLAEAHALVESAATDLRHYADSLDGDPQRLAEVEERLALIKRLMRKHGATLDEVISRHQELTGELDDLANADHRLGELESAIGSADKAARAVATKLSSKRRKAARSLVGDVRGLLAELGMAGAELRVEIGEAPLGPHGSDHTEFLLAANRGEDAKPLAKVASGGELSRIMLAMKLALRRADDVGTYVFDEVDTGIGGVTADAVGSQIRQVADLAQVLCVTHLPQIAAFADAHLHVAKLETGGRVETEVKLLEGAARRDELARMLGGKRITKHARAHADELISAARAR